MQAHDPKLQAQIAELVKANKLVIEIDERDGASFQLYLVENGEWVYASADLHNGVRHAMGRKYIELGADSDDYEGCPKFLKIA